MLWIVKTNFLYSLVIILIKVWFIPQVTLHFAVQQNVPKRVLWVEFTLIKIYNPFLSLEQV